MMNERERIKEKFGAFIRGMERNEITILDSVLAVDCRMRSETLGDLKGVEKIKENLYWKGPKLDFSRYRVYNNCIFREGVQAVQSAYVVATVGVKENYYLHWFSFGGHYLLRWKAEEDAYEKKNTDWRLQEVKYCHDMECGNTAFVSKWWQLINYDKRNGYEKNPIDSQQEAPWRVMQNKSDWSEEEKIIDLYNRYAWGIDENDFEITASVMMDDIYSNIPERPLRGKEKLLEMLKAKREKENTMSHVGKIAGLKINGEEALMRIWRYEPHRIGTKFTHAGNIDTMFYSVDYLWHLKKVRGEWKAAEIDYNIGTFGEADDGRIYQ